MDRQRKVKIRVQRARLWVSPWKGVYAAITRNYRCQKLEFRSQNESDVASLRRLDQMDRAEGEYLILDSEY